MANPGAKFVSVNLNKSYGQQQASHHAPYSSFNGGGGSYGQAAPAGWGRGGGGMTVLSKNRGSAQKVVSKLSVPPPLNLPSLRKEHERFDTLGPGRGAGSGAGPGSGSRPTPTHVGWTKPVSGAVLQEKNESVVDAHVADGMDATDGISRGIGSYMPPSARSNVLGVVGSSSGAVSRDFVPSVEKAMVLRGEDFPSLQAARPVSSETSQKQKDALNQKQKQIVGEELTQNKRDSYHSGTLVDVHPLGQSSWNTIRNGSVENSGKGRGTDRSRLADQIRKEDEYFPSPLPLVRLNPRSDWADDERDTGHGFTERGRAIGYSKNESYWDGNYGLPRSSVLPHKAAQNQHDRWGQRDNDTAGFDERDLFPGDLVGVIKRKKDAAKLTDFHDPVRESFHAELERVLKMQELERQRIIGEQERALEQARREEEEKQRRIREEEERQRRLEEEARESAWRAEHERLEAIRTAEEQRIAREEERIRIYMEEERRKQAAKQMLLDLEARIAKRQAEAAKGDVSVSNTIDDEQLETVVKERDFSRTLDLDTWEDGERIVDKLTTSTSFDSFASSRPYEMSLRPYPPREGSSSFLDGGKAMNYWRRDVFENDGNFPSPLLDQEIDHYSPRQDAFGSGRAVSRLYSYGRSRNSTRQPRVFPPPSLASAQRTSFRGVSEHSGSSHVLANEIDYTNAARNETIRETVYNGSNEGGLEPSEVVGLQQENTTTEDQNRNSKSRCDSQSSLSVSSPPNSPPQLSHDELDESGDFPVKSAVAEVKRNLLTGSGSVVLNSGIVSSDSISASEDEEWTIENDDTFQQQEEYDEDEDGYVEEDEVREGDDENLELNQKFEGLELEERESSHMMDNVVLGFDEGVEVVIPSDDFEKNSGTQEKTYEIPDSSVDIVEERGFVDGVPTEEQNLLNANDASGTSANSSSGKIQETESLLQGSIVQPVDAPYSSATDLLDGADSSGSTGLPAQQSVSCSGDVTAAAGQANMSSLSSAGSPADLPLKLQFGLFSGPSLIPSPVPAIQIGSIQMPLHIHPPVGPSHTHMHPSQPPMFQFGQLQYTSPISQGILSMVPQSMSFIQPNMQAHFNLNHSAGGSLSHQPARDASTQNVARDEVPSLSLNKQPGFVSGTPELSHGSLSRGLNSVSKADSCGDYSVGLTIRGVLGATDKKMESESHSQVEEKEHHEASPKNYLPSSKERGSGNQMQHMQKTIHTVSGEKRFSGPRGLGPLYGGRGKRFAYAVKNANTRSSSMAHDMPENSNGFQRKPQRTVQRTEFRIRENNDRRKAPLLVSFNDAGVDDKSSYTGKAVDFRRSGSKRGAISNRPLKQQTESEPLVSGNISSQEVNSGDRVAKEVAKNVSIKSPNISNPGEANLQKNVSEDVDAPLLRGVVRVYKQPGIEAPSDEDDFIEVRSKRQMLNDRREQREKENKAKSLAPKLPRKPHDSKQNAVISRGPSKLSVPLGNEESCLDFTVLESRHLTKNEVSMGFTTAVFQPLAPIGTPTINSDAQTIKPPQTVSVTVVSSGGTECEPGLMFESKNKVMDQIQSSSTTWSTSGINQQVMSLTQTQLEEAMKPVRYDLRISPVGGHSSTVSDPILPTVSILTKDKTFSSSASPINSLLAGEKIQFGAVTSPTVLPPSSRAVSHGIGAPGSNRSDVQISYCEAEAEAAASAVAVAAICNDDVVRNGLGPLGAVNVPDTKSFGGADIGCITPGVVGDQQLLNQSRGERLLSVSLPADLSVDTTSISLWPPLPSPQSSSSQMISHFSSTPPSHFPFYEMNPMLGGPILAFSPHEESSITQSLPQKSTSSSSGPIGNWQQWHSGVDSFYNPPAGYPGRFISPSGGIPGVQGPPHMVVYNHFAPVGQYGQFGLSFMGTTFIPSGKQSEWKHNQTSSAIHVGEGDTNNINMTTTQRNAPNMMAPIQHLAPGSPLLPMASPLPMFNVSPFQTAPDLSVQPRWGHIPTSPLHSVPVSPPLQPQVVGALPSQVYHGHSVDNSLNVNMFSESRIQTPSDNVPSFSVATETNIAPFPAELGLVDSLRSTVAVTSGQSVVVHSSSGAGNFESGKTDTTQEDGRGNNNSKRQNASSVKPQFTQKNPIQQGNSASYNYRRGGISHRNNAGNEWSNRRVGFHGRNHSSGADRGFPASKMKQIYVAKTEH